MVFLFEFLFELCLYRISNTLSQRRKKPRILPTSDVIRLYNHYVVRPSDSSHVYLQIGPYQGARFTVVNGDPESATFGVTSRHRMVQGALVTPGTNPIRAGFL